MIENVYNSFVEAASFQKKLLAILIDPDVFDVGSTAEFMRRIPTDTTHVFVGGSSVPDGKTNEVVKALKLCTSKPIVLFPGDVSQITDEADGLLFLSLLSGRNPEYLIGQHVRAIAKLKHAELEIMATAYLLIDGGNQSAVARVTNTKPMLQQDIEQIVATAIAGELLGAKLLYLEAGSGALYPVSEAIIRAVKAEISIPLLVGGGIRTIAQKQKAYEAGADMVVMGTVFENVN